MCLMEVKLIGDEHAKAAQEASKAANQIAQTAGKAIDATTGFGAFLGRVFGPALEDVGAVLADRMKAYRFKNLVAFQAVVDETAQRYGISQTRNIAMKVGLPILEAASLEESDEMRKLFANLLLNALDGSSSFNPEKMYVSILGELNATDALVLKRLVEAPVDENGSVRTADLPAAPQPIVNRHDLPVLPDESTQLSLWNLIRLGCLEPCPTWGGSTIGWVIPTPLGRALVKACTIKPT